MDTRRIQYCWSLRRVAEKQVFFSADVAICLQNTFSCQIAAFTDCYAGTRSDMFLLNIIDFSRILFLIAFYK